jgi:hypothetical protein
MLGIGLIFMFVFIFRSLEATPDASVNNASLFFAIALFGLSLIYALIGSYIIYLQRKAQMRQAIAKESMKYSSRSPIPCNWRLCITKQIGGYGDQQRAYYVSSIVL